MKRKKHGSRSTFRVELIVQQPRDEESGLLVSDRFFQPDRVPKANPLLWTLLNAAVLGSLVLGLLRLIVTGFSLTTEIWVFPAALGMCVAAGFAFQSQWCARHKQLLLLPVLLIYMTLLFIFQEQFISGLQQLANRGAEKLNQTYSGSLSMPFAVRGSGQISTALVFLTAPAVLWLSAAILHSGAALMMELLVFPVMLALLLFGAADDLPGLFLVLFGLVLAFAFVRTRRQRRMWGGSNAALMQANRVRFQRIQKQSAVMTLVVCLLLSVPGFLLVRPLLDMSLGPARKYAADVRTDALNRVLKSLPGLTAGQLQLNVEAVSGGVQDGALSGDAGYLLEGVEDLRLTTNKKPVEPLFLKGYIGVQYANGAWEMAHPYAFDGAAINWRTEGAPRLYIQNLPFLRTAFALAQGGEDAEGSGAEVMQGFSFIAPAQLFVQRINANPAYTYVPYGAYLNDYYQMQGGDGSVAGQTDQEDRYFFFQRDEMEAVLTTWNELDDTANVLDRVEESYRAFCHTTFLSVPEGMEPLAQEIAAVMQQERWTPAKNLDAITQWIRRYLAEHYAYELTPEGPANGEDALAYFLFSSHRGNSVHFASAAVVMYRLFGVPARYVVGYEVQPALFSAQAGGLYTATVQGDQSQAWAEIYAPGLGWTPRDMTPGVIGTLEEVGPGGIRVAVDGDTESSDEPTAPPEELTGEDVLVEDDADGQTESAPTGSSLSLEQIVVRIAAVGGGVVLALLLIWGIRRFCRSMGLSLFGRRKALALVVGVFQAIYRRARRLRLPEGVDSQSDGFRIFLKEELEARHASVSGQVDAAMDSMYRAIYGGGTADREDVRRMRRILLGLYKKRARKNTQAPQANENTRSKQNE